MCFWWSLEICTKYQNLASVIIRKAHFGTTGYWGKMILSRVFLQVYLKLRLVQIFEIRHWHSWVNSDGSCFLSGRIKRNYVTFSYSVLYKHQTTGSFVWLVQFSSVAQSCLTLCNPMNRSVPGLPVQHQLPKFAQTHVHWVVDAIQTSHPMSSPSPTTLNRYQHQGLFKGQLFASGGQSIGVSASTSVLPMKTQDWSPLRWTGWIPLQSTGLTRVFSNTIVQKHWFFCSQLSLQSNSHIHTWLLEKPQPWLDGPLLAK